MYNVTVQHGVYTERADVCNVTVQHGVSTERADVYNATVQHGVIYRSVQTCIMSVLTRRTSPVL